MGHRKIEGGMIKEVPYRMVIKDMNSEWRQDVNGGEMKGLIVKGARVATEEAGVCGGGGGG